MTHLQNSKKTDCSKVDYETKTLPTGKFYYLDRGDHLLHIPKDHIFLKAIEANAYIDEIAESEEEAQRIAELLTIVSIPL